MKAKIKVLDGAVRIFTSEGSFKPFQTPITPAGGAAVEVSGRWAVGSATSPGRLTPGEFTVEGVEEGTLVVFHPDQTQERMFLGTGEIRSFATVEWNAFTVESREAAEKEPKE